MDEESADAVHLYVALRCQSNQPLSIRPFRFNSETTASEIDRSARIFVPWRLRERIAVDGKIAIIALRDRLESRSPEEWNSLDLLTWAELVETPAPDAALDRAVWRPGDTKSPGKPGRGVSAGRPSELASRRSIHVARI